MDSISPLTSITFQVYIVKWIYNLIVDAHLKMQVRSGAVAGVAGQTKQITLRDCLTDRDIRFREMPITDYHAVATVYIDTDAIPFIPAGLDNDSLCAAFDRSSGVDREINAVVASPPARTYIG